MLKEIIEFTSHSELDTKRFSDEILRFIKPGCRLLLEGNLGAGKTFLVKQLLNGLGISNSVSPTFAIINEYHDSHYKIYHFDFYRINRSEELIDIGFSEYYNDSDAIVIIEWSNLFEELLYAPFIKIEIVIIDESTRKFILTTHD